MFFARKLQETAKYAAVGPWWQTKKGEVQSEIDLVAVCRGERRALAVEVKRLRRAFREKAFLDKVEALRRAALPNYEIEPFCWDLSDM